MPVTIRPNCAACSKIDISKAKQKNCWDDARCHRRRSDHRNKGERKNKRSTTEIIKIDPPGIYHGILQLWREPREDAPLHAIGLEIKLGDDSITLINPVHCAGWMPSQVHKYIEQILEFTNERYQFKKFSSFVILPPSRCSIKGCSRE